MQVTNIQPDLGACLDSFCQNSEVIPVHQTLNSVSIRLQVEVILMIEVLRVRCFSLLGSLDFSHGQTCEGLRGTIRLFNHSVEVSRLESGVK